MLQGFRKEIDTMVEQATSIDERLFKVEENELVRALQGELASLQLEVHEKVIAQRQTVGSLNAMLAGVGDD